MQEFTFLVGGPQGSGVDSAATLYSRSVAASGYNTFGKREYHSNIKGLHSYFVVRSGIGHVRSVPDEHDIAVTFDAETLFRHALNTKPGGVLVYDPDIGHIDLKAVDTIEEEAAQRILKRFGAGDVLTVKMAIDIAAKKGAKVVPLPYSDLLKAAGKTVGIEQLSTLNRALNAAAVAAALEIIGIGCAALEESIEKQFRGREQIIRMNKAVISAVSAYVQERHGKMFDTAPTPTKEKKFLIRGTTAVALGKIVAGCRVQTYYPITPASDESEYLEEKQNLANGQGVIVYQTEDEIAAITGAIGAALSGARASTSTSGPGFSLMAEGLGWAGMNEVPVVVTLYQRGGPSTGMPTRNEQGDLRFAIGAGHGEFPRIVLSSGDIKEAFYDTAASFNYAEKYQMPVIHLLDKGLANSDQTLPELALDGVTIDRGALLTGEVEMDSEFGFERFKQTESGISPRPALGTKGGMYWNTGDEHGVLGHITEDPANRRAMEEKRMKKLEKVLADLALGEKLSVYGDDDADIVLVSWGSTKGAILDAMDMVSHEVKAKLLHIRLLHPFPVKEFEDAAGHFRIGLVDIENNYSGQLGEVIAASTGLKVKRHILKYTGRPMTSTEIASALLEIKDKTQARVILEHGE